MKINKILITIGILLLFITLTYARERMRLAILDLEGQNVDAATARMVTDLIRTEFLNSGLFRVIERGEMKSILKEQEFQKTGCTDTECAVEMGKLLSARKILLGTVGKLGTKYIINARIVDVEKGEAEFADNAEAASEEDLTIAVKEFAQKIGKRITESLINKLEINSIPSGADIYINSNPSGLTPQELTLEPGTYKIEIKKSGYLIFEKQIYFRGSVTTNISAVLQKRKEKQKQKGRLYITTEPSGAEISIEGKSYGESPLEIELFEGEYEVIAKMPGYDEQEEDVDVKYGETKRIDFNMSERIKRSAFFIRGETTISSAGLLDFNLFTSVRLIESLGLYGEINNYALYSYICPTTFALGPYLRIKNNFYLRVGIFGIASYLEDESLDVKTTLSESVDLAFDAKLILRIYRNNYLHWSGNLYDELVYYDEQMQHEDEDWRTIFKTWGGINLDFKYFELNSSLFVRHVKNNFKIKYIKESYLRGRGGINIKLKDIILYFSFLINGYSFHTMGGQTDRIESDTDSRMVEIGLKKFKLFHQTLSHDLSVFYEFNDYGKLFGFKFSFSLFDDPEELLYDEK